MENSNDIEQWFSTYEGYRKSEIEIIRNPKNWKERADSKTRTVI